MSTGRSPRGPANGALAGDFPDNLAMGATLTRGWHFREDWVSCGLEASAVYGDRMWQRVIVGAGTVAKVTPISSDSDYAHGVIQLAATTTGGNYVTLHQGLSGQRCTAGEPPIGTEFVVGLRNSGTLTSSRRWAGLASSELPPDRGLGNSVNFIGVRRDTGESTSWMGVVRVGTSSDTTVTIVTASSAIHRQMGFVRTDDGYRFFHQDVADVRGVDRTWMGDPIDVHPTGPLTYVLGVQTLNTTTKNLLCDHFELSGRTRRA